MKGETMMNSGPENAPARASQSQAETVLQIMAEVTRYPRSVLVPEADLEDELGIESVKRAEIFSVIVQRLGLKVPKNAGSLGKVKTVGDVIAAVERGLADGGDAPAPAPAPAAPASATQPVLRAETGKNGSLAPPPAPAPAFGHAAVVDAVLAAVASVMRYPRNALRLDSDLEEELGVDFAKRAEVIAAAARALGKAAPRLELPRDGETISDLVALLGGSTTSSAATAARVPNASTASSAPAAPIASSAQRAQSGSGALGAPTVPSASSAATAPRARTNGTYAPAPSIAPAPARPARGVLSGKVALVTGSGRGLGRAIARHLAELGASVVLNSFHSPELGVSAAAELAAAGHDAVHAWGSVAVPEQLDQIFATIEGRYGHLDFLVHNASDVRPGPLAAITADDWHRAFRTEVVALQQAAVRALPLMTRRGGGRIVAISHPAAHRCFQDLALFGTVKAALESLVRYLAVELGPRNIQVNAVSAGPLREHLDRYPDRERLAPQWAARAPGGLPQESAVAAAVAFLLSPDASQILGSVLDVDGGLLLTTG